MNRDVVNSSKKEYLNNLSAIGLAGAAMGLLVAIGFEGSIPLGVITGVLFGIAIGFRMTRKPPRMRFPMYLLRRIAYSATFLLLVSAVYSFLIDLDLTLTQVVLVTILPTVGWAILILSIGSVIASLDEMQRRIQTEAISIAFAGTGIVVAGYSLLQFAGFAEFNIGVVILIMAPMLLIGKIWTLWRYK